VVSISKITAPVFDQYRVLPSGSFRTVENFVGQTSKKLPLNWHCPIQIAGAGNGKEAAFFPVDG
jgi:hypothetical protein